MAIRLVEMRRILKETGSIYLHCDNTMGHYLKILMDIIFGEKNFRNEIVWHYHTSGNTKKHFVKNSDTVFFYSKYQNYYFSLLKNKRYTNSKNRKAGKHNLGHGIKEFFEDEKGVYQHVNMDNVFQIPYINSQAKERTGYPTQKPIALLERIIKASSKEGDIVLDPFCGCATTCIASEKLGRQWVGIDVSFKAYELVKERLKKEVQGIGKQGKLDVNTELKNDYDKLLPNPQNHPPKRTDVNGDDRIIKKYVYIISHPKHKGFYKVGIAGNYKARLNSYQTGDPKRAYKLEYHFLTSHFREIEKHIHSRFNNLLEWVQASKEEIIEEIERKETELLQ